MNYRKKYDEQNAQNLQRMRQIAIVNHPATSTVLFLKKLGVPVRGGRRIGVFLFPSIKKLL